MKQTLISDVEALEQFIVGNDELERLEDMLAEFNLFEALGIVQAETRHSSFIAWLLDPTASHGVGDYFLKAFLSFCASIARASEIETFSPFAIDRWPLMQSQVATERHRIDILVVNIQAGFVCAIENKVRSGEHSNQLHRYAETIAREYGSLQAMHVFLTIDGETPRRGTDAARYIPLGYSDLARLIQRTVNSRRSSMNPQVAGALDQYLATLRRHILVDSDVQELARNIYYQHRRAIDLIIEARPDIKGELRDMVKSVVAERGHGLSLETASKSYVRYYADELESIQALHQGFGWTQSGRMLMFEFRIGDSTLGLYVVSGPGPVETRKRIFDCAQQNPLFGNKERMGSQFDSIYRKPILASADLRDPDPVAMRAKVSEAVEEFIQTDFQPIKHAIAGALQGLDS